MKNHYVRPSSLKSVEICSDFENDESAEIHPVTEQGTRIHFALETGETGNLNEEDLPLYEKMKAQRDQILFEVFGRGDGYEIFHEYEIKRQDTYRGTVDVLAISKETNTGLILDYKAGWNKVDEAAANLQFQAYLSYVSGDFPDVERWEVAIVQPRTGEPSQAVYTHEDIELASARVQMVQKRFGTGQRKASQNCQYCNHIGTCETTFKHLAAVKHQGEMLPILHGLELDTPMDIGQALEVRPVAKKFMEKWDKAVGAAAKEMLGMGVEIQGWEMKQRKGRTQITDLESVRLQAREMGVSDREFAECIKPSLTDIIKKVRENAPSRQKGKFEDRFRDAIKAAIQAGPTTEYVGRAK